MLPRASIDHDVVPRGTSAFSPGAHSATRTATRPAPTPPRLSVRRYREPCGTATPPRPSSGCTLLSLSPAPKNRAHPARAACSRCSGPRKPPSGLACPGREGKIRRRPDSTPGDRRRPPGRADAWALPLPRSRGIRRRRGLAAGLRRRPRPGRVSRPVPRPLPPRCARHLPPPGRAQSARRPD